MNIRTFTILMALSFGIAALSLNVTGVISQTPEENGDESLVETKRAENIIVHFSDRNNAYTFYTFSKIGYVRSAGHEFSLESIPSDDKQPLYQYIAKNLNRQFPDRFEMDIDLVSADGTIIETLNYSKCMLTTYFVYSNDSRGKYRFSDNLPAKMELRDITKFSCLGFSLST